MKIYLSADIEGIATTTHWDEVSPDKSEMAAFARQMTAEVAAACQGAITAGASQILVKDAHASGRNLDANALPAQARLSRGWSGHPLCMVEGLNESFDALLLVGYHAAGGMGSNPLAHTLSESTVNHIRINDRLASEFLISAYSAGLVKVPVVFISGDQGVCEQAREFIPAIIPVAVKEGVGDLTVSIQPQLAVERIQQGVQQALEGELAHCLVKLPEHFQVEISYKEHTKAYEKSFYPGASLIDARTLHFESSDFFEVLRLFMFVV